MAQFNLSITLEYDLVLAGYRLQLVEEVNKKIADGWQPLGGAFVFEDELCQAMVREKPEQPSDPEIIYRGEYKFRHVGSGMFVREG